MLQMGVLSLTHYRSGAMKFENTVIPAKAGIQN